jgi:hypothetical protein
MSSSAKLVVVMLLSVTQHQVVPIEMVPVVFALQVMVATAVSC